VVPVTDLCVLFDPWLFFPFVQLSRDVFELQPYNTFSYVPAIYNTYTTQYKCNTNTTQIQQKILLKNTTNKYNKQIQQTNTTNKYNKKIQRKIYRKIQQTIRQKIEQKIQQK
jgi:hypothetical protein